MVKEAVRRLTVRKGEGHVVVWVHLFLAKQERKAEQIH